MFIEPNSSNNDKPFLNSCYPQIKKKKRSNYSI